MVVLTSIDNQSKFAGRGKTSVYVRKYLSTDQVSGMAQPTGHWPYRAADQAVKPFPADRFGCAAGSFLDCPACGAPDFVLLRPGRLL